ncbi:sigma-54-dependent transcriptional regulator [Desulfonatronum thioautotrophicum]|uniref:sigma-54-dependent transcriptional regulator n=1 Tax=Desulfonatronum thioautotrophicum TaxID=617001 RepID=UPI0005EB7B24|nr:sigma-54 dependent transcriptional regulator [Desulfonatronum thioautotrophicum]
MARVLIIDSDQAICRVLSKKIVRLGHEVQTAHTLEQGLQSTTNSSYDVVYLDVRLPDGRGMDSLARISHGPGAPEVIIITGDSDPDGPEQAIRSGAWDYIQKPSSLKSMIFPLIRALQHREKQKSTASLKALRYGGIVGTSPRMKACMDLLAQVADTEMSVLITGETGTGKELFAKSIHDNSARAKGPYVTVDCASLPENLVESELFGSVKGAFTGASAAREGLIIQANGGSLFLDEIGELPLATQKKFLRVLQERRFRQVGGTTERTSNFRLICATNRDLEEMVEEETFRQDLLYRLQAMHIELPPLRERREDIKDLAVHRMQRLCEQFRVPTKGMSPEFLEALESYDWPGNVRELFNLLENVLFTTRDEGVLYPEHLPMNLRIKIKQALLLRSKNNAVSPESEAPGYHDDHEDDEDAGMPRLPTAAPDQIAVPVTAPDHVPTTARETQPFSESPPVSPAGTSQHDSLAPPPGELDEAFSTDPHTPFPTLRELREKTVGAMEKRYLKELLARSDAELSTALELSGLSRARFYELLKKHSVSFR